MSGPGGAAADRRTLAFYTGLFGGIVLTDLALLGVLETGLFRIAIGAVVGLAAGWSLSAGLALAAGHDD